MVQIQGINRFSLAETLHGKLYTIDNQYFNKTRLKFV
jgi:hypothetical protein